MRGLNTHERFYLAAILYLLMFLLEASYRGVR